MEKIEQLKSILTDLDNKELTKHQAHDLICVLFSVSKSFVCGCDKPNISWYGTDDNKQYFCFNCRE